MANLHDCLQSAIDAGELEKQRGQAAQSEFNQLVERYSQAMPIHQAEATAAAHLKEATSRAARSRRHAVLNQLQTMVRLKHLVETSDDPAIALRNLLERSEGSGFKGESIQSLSQALEKSVNDGLQEYLRDAGRNLIGNSREPALLNDVIRILHGDDVGSPAAKALAEAVRQQQQRMRRLFNAHGGDIGELADYGVTHSHDAARMRKMGYQAWRAEIAPKLDWHRITDHTTGKPFAAEGQIPADSVLDPFLREIFDGITTGGWSKRDPSMAMGGKALYNRRAEPRILHFKSGQDWLDYNKAFGTSDPFSAVIGSLHGMARDVAQMRVLGPNPKAGLEFAIQTAKRHAANKGDDVLMKRVGNSGQLAQTMLAHFDGSVNFTEATGWANFFSGTRKILTSIQLGSAPLSAVTDTVTITAASQAMGMSATNTLARSAKLMASHATRETAARMGYVADTLASAGATAARFTGDVLGPEVAERLSGFTMRASGLSYWTDMNKIAFQMEFAGFLADNAGRSFDAIDEPLRRLFQDRGITAADWDALRAPEAMFRTETGETFLSPMHWLKHQTAMPEIDAEGLAMRLQMAIEEQLEYAVPTASLEGRARMLGNTQPGTFAGELLRSSLMYKSFALSLTMNQYRRFMAIPGPLNKAVYAAKMAAGLWLMGAVAAQLKELAKGRDPRPMDEGKFWMAALFQGGGLGIFGDFFASETSRAGGGLGETLAGPVAGFASDLIKPIAGNITAAVEGRDLTIGRDAANLLRYNTPVASSLWYTRLGFDRLVADQIQLFLDPGAETRMRRQEAARERNYGSATFWPRGELTPSRPPDFSNVRR